MNKYALCLVYRGNILHYLIQADRQGRLSIEDGELYYNLIQVRNAFEIVAPIYLVRIFLE